MDIPWFWLIAISSLLVFFAGCVWLLVRMLSHVIAANTVLKGKLHYPSWFIVAAVFGLFGLAIPVVNLLLVFAFAFFIKPKSTLMRTRDSLVASMTPEDIVASVEQQVRANPATPLSSAQISNPWVQQVWMATSHDGWVHRLHAHDSLFRQALQDRLKIEVGSLQPYANWIELMQYFTYLESSAPGQAD